MSKVPSVVQILDRVRSSLWFLPGLMALGALILGVLAPAADRRIPSDWLLDAPRVFSGNPAGARAILATIATSMITIAGIVFSMTIVSLQLAASQFGPRLLRTFLRDRGNQVVFGTFLATFLYCVLILPTIDGGEDELFVPRIGVTIAVVLAVVGLAMLVYFLNHVAQSIHADAVIAAVGCELDTVIDELFPDSLGEDGHDEDDGTTLAGAPMEIEARASGYVRFIDGDALLDVATRHDLTIKVVATVGSFVIEGDDVAHVWPASRQDTDVIASEICAAVALGTHRTALQDTLFVFEQLVEMAVRALSPGINDPTTAKHCIDRIGTGLCRLVTRRMPSPLRRDENQTVRVIAVPVTVDDILAEAIEPLARHAGVHLTVWLGLLRILDASARRARRPGDRAACLSYARRIAATAHAALENEHDRDRLAEATAFLPRPAHDPSGG
ncbi:MAG: DUF2254 domain-containing protein [Phycisphaerales bacterium]|nr:DUF2254 domain-containing protein [Phycisphaerales bacterium]NNM27176.1 DUF2254 domain-containing protein [Phycisphaerales bacterium]